MLRRWRIALPPPPDVAARFPEFAPLMRQLLANRGLTGQKAVDEFLEPDWGEDVGDPFQFRAMRKAVGRIITAINKQKRIVVFGDYDADGICGSALLFETLFALGAKVEVYLPDRVREGYGLNIPAIEGFEKSATKVLITVDCGITSVKEIERANELGMDVIIVDHHHEPPELPKAFAIINPVVKSEAYPFRGFCGTGTAFKLAQALLQLLEDGKKLERPVSLPHGWEKWLLDLVAIATVADFSPLQGENRTLVHYGLLVLRKTRRMGLKALFERARIVPGAISTTTISFQIAPRLNAAGRMDHASASLFLLTTKDEVRARTLADDLEKANQNRQALTDKIAREATEQIGDAPKDVLLAAVGPAWPSGVIGIVAGRVMNKYYRPALILGREGDRIVGSGRSIPDYDITEALERCREYLNRFGGHPQACGFTITGEDKAKQFLATIKADAAAKLAGISLAPQLRLDAAVALHDASWELIDIHASLEPFGEKNPRPAYAAMGLCIQELKPIGTTGQHLRLVVEDQKGERATFIAFGNGAELQQNFSLGTMVDIAFELDVNEWSGNRELQRKVLDIRGHEAS